MSDPRKNFICLECGHVINDNRWERPHGAQSKCMHCDYIEYLKRKELIRVANPCDYKTASEIPSIEAQAATRR